MAEEAEAVSLGETLGELERSVRKMGPESALVEELELLQRRQRQAIEAVRRLALALSQDGDLGMVRAAVEECESWGLDSTSAEVAALRAREVALLADEQEHLRQLVAHHSRRSLEVVHRYRITGQ